MDCYLLVTHHSVEGALDIGTANSLRRLGQKVIELLDMITSTNTKELENWLIILQSQHGLVTCEGVSFAIIGLCLSFIRPAYCHET